jgi:hypothetical protein
MTALLIYSYIDSKISTELVTKQPGETFHIPADQRSHATDERMVKGIVLHRHEVENGIVLLTYLSDPSHPSSHYWREDNPQFKGYDSVIIAYWLTFNGVKNGILSWQDPLYLDAVKAYEQPCTDTELNESKFVPLGELI